MEHTSYTYNMDQRRMTTVRNDAVDYNTVTGNTVAEPIVEVPNDTPVFDIAVRENSLKDL